MFHIARPAAIASLAAAAFVTIAARSDVIIMTDGRRFEGEILKDHPLRVTIDAKVSERIRATITLERPDIEKIEKKALPPGFFDPPPAPERRSDVAGQPSSTGLYLEVPIRGEFGKDVLGDGIDQVLRYARRHRIRHIVFYIDSTGGSLDEAADIYKLLRRSDEDFDFHALVKNCLGTALAIPVWCEQVLLLPGASIGGTSASFADLSSKIDPEQEQVMRSQIARNVATQAEKRGYPGDVVRAMLDPTEVLAGWTDADGRRQIGRLPPSDLPAERLVFQVGTGESLVLSRAQAVALGAPKFEGTVQDLGQYLGIKGWEPESDYGREAMGDAMVKQGRVDAKSQAEYTARVKQVLERRELAENHLEHNLKGAAQWDPEHGNYDSYSRRWGWGWGWDDDDGGGGTWSQESQTDWRNRSDTTMRYLRDAAQALKALAQLEKEAAELGLEPVYEAGELQGIADDIQTKYDQVVANRDRMRQ